jgi:hypothetical protein
MEQAMGATSWGESGIRRVVVIGAGTAAVIIVALFAKPFYSATADTKAPRSVNVSQPSADQGPAIEAVSFAISPADDANSEFFFGCGDGSNGYYAEQPAPRLALVRYERMP